MEKLRELVIIIMMIMIIRMNEICECCIESERDGLLQIKSSFKPNSPNYLTSWGTLDSDCCNWDRVECNSTTGHIISLDLYTIIDLDLGDYWYLNASLFLPFQQLNRLYLDSNNIAGCVQNEGFERLSALTNFEYFTLSSNKFNNTILQSLSGLSSLKSLYLTNNELNGTIDVSELNNLTSTLQVMEFSGNEIECFNNMEVKFSKLEHLGLRKNGFNSSIFPFLKELSWLKTLDLGFNNFKGYFNFKELGDLNNLQVLDLSGNEITQFIFSKGPIWNLSTLYMDNMTSTIRISNFLEESFRQWPNLKTLSLMDNNLTGEQLFGEGIKGFNKLESLYLSGNQLNQKTTNFLQNIGRLSFLKTLSFRRCGLEGYIPANSQGLCGLKNLQQLHMSYNDLNGKLPECLVNLTSLQYLDLSSNQFTGKISLSPLQRLTSLEFLNISHNFFQVPISLSPFFNLSLLTVLCADNNTIYTDREDHNLNPKFQLETLYLEGYGEGGALPKFLYYQHSLYDVIISSINLRGRFPYWLLQNNTGLNTLDLSNNSLTGPIQLPIHPHVSLQTLYISDNFFNDSIPSQIGAYFPSLSALGISRNKLKGRIPNSLCNINGLYFLDTSRNSISGTIPNCIGNMSQLGILDLSNNKVFGSVPSNFSQSFLAIVNLSKNRLQGSLNDAFYSCIGLFLLDLSNNNFCGSIPSWIGELSELSFLVLGRNYLHGEIPIELCKLKQLSYIDLSHNRIHGYIPCCLNITSSWSRKQYVDKIAEPLEITMKGRTYPYEQEILTFISGIDMSCNNLSGQIPLDIGNLRNIKLLNLSHNSLVGTIPTTLSDLKEIESLDLSCNSLHGIIPPQLTQLTSLAAFNVSYNNLSGQTPNRVAQFATFDDNSSYIGNMFLCGWPLSKSCTLNMPQWNATTSLYDEESSSLFVDMEFFYVSFGVTYVIVLLALVAILCINPYWRKVWFYYVQMSIDNTRYFVIDHVIPLFSRISF